MRLLHPIVTALGFLALLCMALAFANYRGGATSLAQAFAVIRIGAALGLCATAGAIFTLLALRPMGTRLVLVTLSAVIGLGCFFVPYRSFIQMQRLPALDDISTDLTEAPPFITLARPSETFALRLTGDSQAPLQRQGYPDLRTEVYAMSPGVVSSMVVTTLRRLGWETRGSDDFLGTIEATRASAWLGIRHELVVRIASGPGGATEVDVRSRSVDSWNGHDLGANAANIREFIAALRERLVPGPQ